MGAHNFFDRYLSKLHERTELQRLRHKKETMKKLAAMFQKMDYAPADSASSYSIKSTPPKLKDSIFSNTFR